MGFFLSALFLFFSFFSFGFSANSWADDGIEDLKAGCTDPGRYHNQNPITMGKVTCFDFRVEWLPAGHDDAEIHNKRTVCSYATTDKPNIKAPKVCEPCDWPGSDYECGGLKEVEKELEMTFTVNCDEILKMVTINKFCQGIMLAHTTAAKEEILTVTATGKTFNSCTGKISMNGKETDEVPQTAWVKK